MFFENIFKIYTLNLAREQFGNKFIIIYTYDFLNDIYFLIIMALLIININYSQVVSKTVFHIVDFSHYIQNIF